MKALLVGGSGMIGSLIIEQCLHSEHINEVISLVRKPSTQNHHKLTQIIIQDFEEYTDINDIFQNVAVGFFCIGAYTGQVSNDVFKKITVDYAVAFASALKRNSQVANLCMLSGAGADRTEKSRTAFARFKGMAENQISELEMTFFSFRPAYIYPVSPRKEPNLMYRISRILYPLIKLFGKNASIKSTELAKAMFHVGLNGADMEILENKDILEHV